MKIEMRNTRKGGKVVSVSIVSFGKEAARQLEEALGRTRRKSARRDDTRRTENAAARKNRARVVAAIRDLRRRRGLSVAKAIRHLRGNAYWSPRMKGVIDRSWASYYYGK